MFLLLSLLLHIVLYSTAFYSPPISSPSVEVSTATEEDEVGMREEREEELGDGIEDERDDERDDEVELSLPPFTLLEFAYFDALREEMLETQQFPFNPIEGQGRELAFDAQNGDAMAQYSVGLSMVAFTFHDLDRVTQVRRSWLLQSAMQGYKPAQKLLALLYLNSAGAPRLSKARRWLNALAMNGDAEAKAELLYLASQGLIDSIAPDDALAELRLIADGLGVQEQGDLHARARYSVQLGLGMHAALGIGGQTRDTALALRYFSKARAYAMSNGKEAVLAMGDFSPDDASLELWERDLASLAQQGDAEACYFYALWLLEGLTLDDQVEDAEELGLHYMNHAASAGLADAHYELAYRVIDPWSESLEGELSKEQQEAITHYQLADERGCAAAAVSLSRCYESMGKSEDAEQVLRNAIARHDDAARVNRENKRELSALLLEWDRLEEARDLYESMATQGDKDAMVQLISLYRNHFLGEGSTQRVEELLKQLEKIAPSRAHYLRNEK